MSEKKTKKTTEYNHAKLEPRWQKEWDAKKIYAAKEGKGKKFFALIEFPYPSGAGLHVGHIRSNTAMDIISRKRRMQGYNVLYPIGWDAFGLPTEQYAIKTGAKPVVVTKKNTDIFRKQLKSVGFGFDWSREVNTTDPAYYKWTQWLFLQFYKKGLAYKAKTTINWCPKDKIGLANEEVVDGCCERCGTPTEKREKEQWMMAITKYADRLDKDLDTVDYPERVKSQQRNWIGKSEGSEIAFSLGGVLPKRVVVLHGRGATPEMNFIPWLKLQLEAQGVEVQTPLLPNTKNPNDIEQADFVAEHVSLDENTVVVGHSFGGLVAMRLLERGIKLKGVVFVGTPISGTYQDGKDRPAVTAAIKRGFDYATIRKNATFFTALYDANDAVVPTGDGEMLAQKVGVVCHFVTAQKSHFCGKEEPAILRTIAPSMTVFTTRADTLFGVTYVVLAPEHTLVTQLLEQVSNKKQVQEYIALTKKKDELLRAADGKEKTGVPLEGIFAKNPITGELVPVWIADYVLPQYGTGAVMAVPAHDERDALFAQAYNLPVKNVISENGTLENSGEFDGMDSAYARTKITEAVGGKIVTKFKLRDWVFSRQRYWGEPIPLVHCADCGWVPVPEKELPVMLPQVKSYTPTDNGESPLAIISKWVNTKCPKCKGKARRETDTMPNWAGSSWYYLRYTDPKNKSKFADPKKLKYWTPVDWYNGGMEHTTLHLLYSRFWHKFFYDMKLVPTKEPYQKRTSHGMILAEGGAKMSKSKGNVVNPDDIVKTYGADTLRLYEMFMGPVDQAVVWSTDAMIGPRRFIERVWRLESKVVTKKIKSPAYEIVLNQTIKKVGEDIESMGFNTAVSQMMICLSEMEKADVVAVDDFKKFLQILAPFAPHVTEELWHMVSEKKSIHLAAWPKYNPAKLVSNTMKIMLQVNGKLRGEITVDRDATEKEITALALAEERLVAALAGATPKRIIYVAGRLVNFVV